METEVASLFQSTLAYRQFVGSKLEKALNISKTTKGENNENAKEQNMSDFATNATDEVAAMETSPLLCGIIRNCEAAVSSATIFV